MDRVQFICKLFDQIRWIVNQFQVSGINPVLMSFTPNSVTNKKTKQIIMKVLCNLWGQLVVRVD